MPKNLNTKFHPNTIPLRSHIASMFFFALNLQITSTKPSLKALEILDRIFVLTFFFFSNGTSFVSLYIPPKDAMNNVNNLLNSELAGAENIKSKQTRESIKSAITSIKESK